MRKTLHFGVKDLRKGIRVYSDMFGMPPDVERLTYAKWDFNSGLSFMISLIPDRKNSLSNVVRFPLKCFRVILPVRDVA